MKSRLIIIVLVLISSFCTLGYSEDLQPKTPNILFIIVDDLGYGDLGATGHPFIDTPHLDNLAKRSAVFKNFYSPASICSPARAAMMTGRMPYRLGIYSFIYNGGGYVHLRKNERTFPQLLRKAGYQTALIGKWHVSHNDDQEKFNLPTMNDYGFDYWFSADNNTIIKDKPGWWKNGEKIGVQKGLAANVVGREARHWLEKERQNNKPFMLSVHFYEPHWLVTGPENLVKKYSKKYESEIDAKTRAHYPACIENVDLEVGLILAKLEELKLDNDTIVIFTSDHGPAAHKKGSKAWNRNDGRAAPYRGNKYGLWDGSVHVPGFIHWPGVTKAGQMIEAPAGGIDFLPTVCAMAGVRLPDNLKLDGADISPLLRGKKNITRPRPLQWHHYNSTLRDSTCPQAVLRHDRFILAGFYESRKPIGSGRWYPKYHNALKNSELTRFALYDLEADPTQQKNISKSHPELFEKLKKQLITTHKEMQNEAYGWEEEAAKIKKSK